METSGGTTNCELARVDTTTILSISVANQSYVQIWIQIEFVSAPAVGSSNNINPEGASSNTYFSQKEIKKRRESKVNPAIITYYNTVSTRKHLQQYTSCECTNWMIHRRARGP